MKENKELMKKIASLEDYYWWYTGRRKILEKFFKRILTGEQNVLNIGCGTGEDSLCASAYAKIFNTDYSLVVLMLNRLKGNGRHFKGDCLELPVKDSFFDSVFCLDVIEHVKEDKKALVEICRILVPETGSLLITVPAYNWLWTSRDDIEEHYTRYNKSTFEALLKNVGFEIVFSSYFNTLLFPLTLLNLLLDRFHNTQSSEYNFPKFGKITNLLLHKIFAFERHLIPWPGLPFGKSIICLCRPSKK